LAQRLHNLITILPQGANGNTATAKQDNGHYGNNERGVVLFWLVNAGGHLVVHDFFSWVE
jgi:hypothetical protein